MLFPPRLKECQNSRDEDRQQRLDEVQAGNDLPPKDAAELHSLRESQVTCRDTSCYGTYDLVQPEP